MRWMRLVALMGLAFVALLTSAAGATAKSAAFKTGTYKLKPAGYTVTLKELSPFRAPARFHSPASSPRTA